MTPIVADLYHGDTVHGNRCEGFQVAYNAGLRGVIHKATQGCRMADSAYGYRRPIAIAAGLLWGAYHFNTGEPVADQVDNFFTHAEPDDATLMAIDFEDNRLSEMSIEQLVDFLELADAKLGRPLTVYGGNRLKEYVGDLGEDAQSFLGSHPLWLCQYGPKAVVPKCWTAATLWQYTGDGIGPQPHKFPGFEGGSLDLNIYNGQDLAKFWSCGMVDASTPPGPNPRPALTPSHSDQGRASELPLEDIPLGGLYPNV